MTDRASGILVPLFSVRSSRGWGIGEFRDLAAFAPWVRAARQSFVQILPMTEVPSGEASPYSALTAMALDPIFISLPAMEDFAALGGDAALGADERQAIAAARTARRVQHHVVRTLKGRWLRRAYDRFAEHELPRGSSRAERFDEFSRAHAAWLDDYALFRALRSRYDGRPWWEWPSGLARREAASLAAAARDLQKDIAFHKYMQWVAGEQWAAARRGARPVRIFGDVPFMISADSPDVWTRQAEFRFDATVGVPPDAFSATGQDWGLPPWRWDVMAANDFAWIRHRARRTTELFDGYRLDHLVGLYRIYNRPLDRTVPDFFSPAGEAEQRALGEQLVNIYRATGAEVIAEDLGTVPDFVRASLQQLEIPGFKVMRWERRWSVPGHPFIDPSEYDEVSVATTGTHDTDPLASWWDTLGDHDRAAVLQMPSVQRRLASSESPVQAQVRALLAARSRLAIVPVQDVFGWRDRINTPAVVSDANWSWTLPWPVDDLFSNDEARRGAERLARWTTEADRLRR